MTDQHVTPSFAAFLDQFERHDVVFLVIGSYACAALARPRYVKDLDLWLERSERNASRVVQALEALGFGGLGLTVEDFTTDTVIELGYPPVLVDLMNSRLEPRTGKTFLFADEYPRRIEVRVDGTRFPLAHTAFHLEIKRLCDRIQDIDDAAALERGDPEGRTIEERIREIERLRRHEASELGDPDRPMARAVRRKRIVSKS